MIEASKCLLYKFESIDNSDEAGGIITARAHLDELKNLNKPFLDKHSEYEEDYEFKVTELVTELTYIIYNKELHGSKESRGNI